MTNERARTELEQLYMSLSEEKKKALDVAFKAMEQADGEYKSNKELLCDSCYRKIAGCQAKFHNPHPVDHCIEYKPIETQADGEYITQVEDMPTVAIPSAEPKWIPVSERLPKDDGLYLVYTEEQPFVCPFEDGEFFIDEVLAWMPLPSPYQPQERSDKK